MRFVRVLSERLLLFLLLLSRIAFVAVGLAVLGATFAFGGFLRAEHASPVILSAWRWIQLTGGLFLAAGMLLFILRSWVPIPRAGVPGLQSPKWTYLIALCLAGQIIVGALASQPIRSLWQDAIPALRQAGVFEQASSSSEMSGVVLAPVIAVMLVPILETLATAALIVLPFLLLVLFLTRSRAFPRSFVLTVILQAALVAGAFLATNAFTGMAQRLLAATAARASQAPVEFQQALAGLRRIQQVIGPTARSFALLLLPVVIWIPPLLFSRRVESAFPAGSFDTVRAPRERMVPGHGEAA